MNTVWRLRPDGHLAGRFGDKGEVELERSGQVGGVALQPDGKIVTTTADGVFRLTPRGELDRSFAGDGRRPISRFTIQNVALQPDRKIVICGNTIPSSAGEPYRFALARLEGG